MTNRRKDDERIEKLIGLIERQGVLVEQVHRSWFGSNGNDGYKTKIDKMIGGLAVWKWIAGSGGLTGLVALLIVIYKLLRGLS